MWAFFKHELKEFLTNRKNIAIYLLLIFLSLFYWLQIENNFEIIERVSREELQASVDTKSDFLKKVNREGEIHPDTQAAIEAFPAIVENEEQQVRLLDKKDYKQFSKVRSQWYESYKFKPSPMYFKDGSPTANLAVFYNYSTMFNKLSRYSEMDEPIDLAIIDEKTAIQSLVRAMDYLLPIILVVTSFIFSMDLLSRDRKHKSLVKGMPLTDGKKIVVKILVAFIGTMFGLIPLSIGFVGIGLTNGFGYLNLPIGISYFQGKIPLLSEMHFESIPVSTYILRFLLLISLLILVAILINLLLGMWIKNAYFLFIVTLGLPFIELFYNRPGYADIHPIHLFPTSYLHVGEIISGQRSLFWSGTQITFSFGLIVVGITLLVLSILLFGVNRFKRTV